MWLRGCNRVRFALPSSGSQPDRLTTDRTTMRQSMTSTGVASAVPGSLRELLRVDRSFGLVDVCLALVAITSLFSNQFMLLMQATFLLLMLGACYWGFAGFLARTVLWAGIATTQLVAAVWIDDAPAA